MTSLSTFAANTIQFIIGILVRLSNAVHGLILKVADLLEKKDAKGTAKFLRWGAGFNKSITEWFLSSMNWCCEMVKKHGPLMWLILIAVAIVSVSVYAVIRTVSGAMTTLGFIILAAIQAISLLVFVVLLDVYKHRADK